MGHSTETKQRRFSLIWTGVVIHTLLVAFFGVVLLVSQGQGLPRDANIGAAFATFPLAVLGFPWSVVADNAVSGGGSYRLDIAFICAALINLGLHAWIIRLLDKRVAD